MTQDIPLSKVPNPQEYRRVADAIQTMLREGELKEHDKLPSERQLAQELSVSRNSVREGIKILCNMGLVESRHGSGNFVTGNVTANLPDVIRLMMNMQQITDQEILSFRRNIEKAVCLSLMESKTFASHAVALRILAGHHDTRSDREFHQKLMEFTGNRLWYGFAAAIIPVYRDLIDEILESASHEAIHRLSIHHKAIVDAIADGQRELLLRAIDAHYDLVEEIRQNRMESVI